MNIISKSLLVMQVAYGNSVPTVTDACGDNRKYPCVLSFADKE